MKNFLLFIFLSMPMIATAQSGMLWDRYYISGSLSVGQGSRSFADNSAWLQLGNDSTTKGLLMPRVLLDSITTTKRALFVYDLKDSVLYHFDGSQRVRYMTYKDSTFIKLFVFNGLTADKIPAGDTNKYYSDAKARGAISAGTGIDYNSTTGVFSNTGVTSVDGSSGAIDLATTYHMQGGNNFGANAVAGSTDNFGFDIKTNNTTKFSISNVGRATFSGSLFEDILTLSNDKTNKLVLGVGRGGGVTDNVPYILFGNNSTSDPSMRMNTSGSPRMDLNRIDVLHFVTTSTSNIAEVRGTVNGVSTGNNFGIGTRANGQGGGHTGTSGTLNWLVLPLHVGNGSDIKPTSGNMQVNMLYMAPKINQTGTANGITRGIYIAPVLTSAADFRAIQIDNATGWGIYQPGAATNYLNGNTGIKVLNATEALEVGGNIKTAQPSANGAGAFKIGKVITGASVTIQTDKYLEIEIDGVLRKLAIAE